MKGLTAFACLSDLDPDLIEESACLLSHTAPPAARKRRTDTALSRFFGSGWGVAVICAVVSLGVLVAIVLAGQGSWVTPPPPDTVESETPITEREEPTEPDTDGETTSTEEPDTEAWTDAEEKTADESESATEPVTEGETHPDVTEGGLTFISNGDGTCSVKGADKTMEGVLRVPAQSPYGDTVTTVLAGAFRGFSSLTEVHLPDTVTVIKSSAFQSCGSLEQVTLPPVVTEFGKTMFDRCGELRSVVLPAGLTEIPGSTFQTCVSLSYVEARDGVTAIGANAFNGCRSLHELVLPAGLKSIGSQAFMNCCGLVTIRYGGTPEEWAAVKVHEVENSHLGHARIIYE